MKNDLLNFVNNYLKNHKITPQQEEFIKLVKSGKKINIIKFRNRDIFRIKQLESK